MSSMFDSITKGLTEAIEFEQGKISARRNTVKVTPPSEFSAAEIKEIRRKAGLTQVAFANVLGVSPKTVEAWERGRNRPDGPARRMMGLLHEDARFAEKHGFLVLG